jgi:hypothetical protein
VTSHAAESSDPANTRIIVHGLFDDVSAEDLESSAKCRYRLQLGATGHTITAFKTKTSTPVPDANIRSTLTESDTQGELVFVQIVPVGCQELCRGLTPDEVHQFRGHL